MRTSLQSRPAHPPIPLTLYCVIAMLAPGTAGAQVPTSDAAAARRGTPNGAWASSYVVPDAPPTLIRGATLLTATGQEEVADLVLADGRIAAIGPSLEAPDGAVVVDGRGRWVTPGLIDAHSHIGVSPVPEVERSFNNNETGMTTPNVWIEHAIWPQGPGFARALAGGTTTLHLLPGSGDLIEGRGVTVKPVPARTAQQMIVPGAPHTLKMACGENPRNGSGFPNTKMGNVAGYRAAFIEASRYRDEWDAWLEAPEGDAPERDLGLETLAEVLRGNILVQWHCYTADEMATNLEVAREFGFRVRSFHHAVEAYKVRDLLAQAGVSASMWSENWGFKMEALDGIPENVALVSSAGARAVVHSDDDMRAQFMNHEAAKSMWAARRAGMDVGRDEAIRWVTANPAWAVGVEDEVGTLEVGKRADVVLWSGDPFSVYTLADQVWIDGALRFDRMRAERQPLSDFEIGLHPRMPDPVVANRGGGPQRPASPAEVDVAPADGTVAIVGGTVHTVSGPVVEDGVVVLRDGRIVAVGPAGTVSVPASARVLDATGKVVTPGLFDASTTLGLTEVGSLSATRDASWDEGADRSDFRVGDGLNARSMAIPVVRTEGVTNAVIAPTGGILSGQGAAVALRGPGRADMLVREPVGLWVNLGADASAEAGGSRGGVVLELRRALDAARAHARETDAEEDHPPSDPVADVLSGRLPLVVRASSAGDIEMALELQDAYGFRMIVDGGEEAWMVAPTLAARGVPVILRALENRPTRFNRLGTRFDAPALLERAGVPVILTTRSAHRVGTLPHEAGSAVRHGMSHQAALRAVTLAPAEAFGLGASYGSLEEGKLANVVVWSDDPFEFSGYAEQVFIHGHELSMDSRQRRLFERYRTLDGDEGYRRGSGVR